ncbi:MAG: hypothetical protein OQK98_01800 [Gammaproteobacteria bacterium]|nr:hypothetical protein [Gammaproteobacteria bacterium]
MRIKGDHQVIIAIIIFFIGFILRGLTEGDQLPIKDIITGLIALISAYAGASFAFKLQHDKEEREKIAKQIASSNRAIHTLYDIWNVQKQFQEEHIKPFRERDDAWLNMSPIIPGIHTSIKFNVENLEFLLSSGEPEIYAELMLEEKRYRIAISVIEERSKLVFDKVFPKMEELGFKKGEKTEQVKIEEGLGPDLTNRLQKMTPAIITIIDENIESLINVYEKLQAYLNEIFPNEKFIKVQFTKPDEQQN